MEIIDGRDEDGDDVSFRLFSTKKVIANHEVYLGETFDSPTKYTSLFNLLEHAGEEDTITFYLNSYGGRLDAGAQLGHKLGRTAATTKTIIEAPVYSMGAVFPFMTDSFEMRPNTFLMFHNYSSGYGRQKGNEIALSADATGRYFTGMLNQYCSKLLTKAEIKGIISGVDLYLFPEDIEARSKPKKAK